MSSAQETINKLSEALNTLIKAYEELQNENSDLKKVVVQLKEEKVKIIQENNNLQDNVSILSDNTEQQNSSMYNMLDKIELLLSSDVKEKIKEVDAFENNEFKNDHTEPAGFNAVDTTKEDEVLPVLENEPEEENLETSKDNKIDLNRMASLLNGFNK